MLDTLIIGAGPAGLTAAFYATQYGLTSLCIGDALGGKLLIAPDILNYPGVTSITGKDYTKALMEQLTTAGSKADVGLVNHIETVDRFFKVTTDQNKSYDAQTVIFATGNGNKQKTNYAQDLAQKLGIHLEQGFFIVDKNNMTVTPGIFAAGDCVIYPQGLEQLANVVASGIKASIGVYEYLKNQRPPILWGKANIPRVI